MRTEFTKQEVFVPAGQQMVCDWISGLKLTPDPSSPSTRDGHYSQPSVPPCAM